MNISFEIFLISCSQIMFQLNQTDSLGVTFAWKFKILCLDLEEEISNPKCLYARKTFPYISLVVSGLSRGEENTSNKINSILNIEVMTNQNEWL